MKPHRLVLAVPDDGAFVSFTRGHVGLVLESTPLGSGLLLKLGGNAAGARAVEAAFGPALLRVPADGAPEVLVLADSSPTRSMVQHATAAGVALLHPLRFTAGEVVVEAVAWDEAALAGLRDRWPGCVVRSKRAMRREEVEAGVPAAPLLLPALTVKQAGALLAALERGYYEAPRRTTTAEVARAIGVARSTFEEHLKRAEGQVVRALAPVARMRAAPAGDAADAARAEALELYARFSEALGLSVEVALRGGRVARVRLTRSAAPGAGPEHPYLARILEHLATGKGDLHDVPVDLRVGPFEREVLEALRTIPPGEVVTYGDLARRLGRPGAARAVGNACARNPVPIIVPCHRVVPAGGGLGNYSAEGGAETKRKLLVREGALRDKSAGTGGKQASRSRAAGRQAKLGERSP